MKKYHKFPMNSSRAVPPHKKQKQDMPKKVGESDVVTVVPSNFKHWENCATQESGKCLHEVHMREADSHPESSGGRVCKMWCAANTHG